jgi:Fe-Mn family superoxide dismutase
VRQAIVDGEDAMGRASVGRLSRHHTTTLAGGRPVLVLDMYEHAYHMDYGAAASRYVDVFMEAIRWDNAVKLYDRYSRDT